MRRKRTAVLLAALAIVTTGVAATTSSASAAAPIANLTGTAPASLAGQPVTLLVEVATNWDATGDVTELMDVPVNWGTTDANGNFNVPLPDNTTVNSSASGVDGLVNTLIEVGDSTTMSFDYTPVYTTDTSPSARAASGAVPTVHVGKMPAPTRRAVPVSARSTASPMDPPASCSWNLDKKLGQHDSRVGRLYLANVKNSTANWIFQGSRKVEMEVGLTDDMANYKSAGTIGVSGSDKVESNALLKTPGTKKFVETHITWGKFDHNNAIQCPSQSFSVRATKLSDGSSFFDSSGVPPASSYTSCHSDPSKSFAVVEKGSHWADDKARQQMLALSVTVAGFGAEGKAGWSSDTKEDFHAGDARTYVCGDGNPAQDSHILYNKDY